MAKKAYCVSIYLDVFNVSCPGVWLCPKGKVHLRASLFGVSDTTKKVEPIYPLVFNERFIFQKAFTGVKSTSQLEGALEKKELLLDLVQVLCGGCKKAGTKQQKITLSSFRAPVCQVIYPRLLDPPGGPVLPPNQQRVTSTASEIDLLLTPSSKYPGILAPKVSVSARCSIQELKDYSCKDDLPKPLLALPTRKLRFRKHDGIIRQRRVCHSKRNHRCGCYTEPKKRVHGEALDLDQTAIFVPVVQPGKLRKCISSSPYRSSEESTEGVPGNAKDEVGLLDVGSSTGGDVGRRKCCSDIRTQQRTVGDTRDCGSTNCQCAICAKYNHYFNTDNSLAVPKIGSGTIDALRSKKKKKSRQEWAEDNLRSSSGFEDDDVGKLKGPGCICSIRGTRSSSIDTKKPSKGCGFLCNIEKPSLERQDKRKRQEKSLPPCVCVRKESLVDPGHVPLQQRSPRQCCSPPTDSSQEEQPRSSSYLQSSQEEQPGSRRHNSSPPLVSSQQEQPRSRRYSCCSPPSESTRQEKPRSQRGFTYPQPVQQQRSQRLHASPTPLQNQQQHQRRGSTPPRQSLSQLEPPQHHLLPEFHPPIGTPKYDASPHKTSPISGCRVPPSFTQNFDIDVPVLSGPGLHNCEKSGSPQHLTRGEKDVTDLDDVLETMKKCCKCSYIDNLPPACCSQMAMVRKCETYRHLFYENLGDYYKYLLCKLDESKSTDSRKPVKGGERLRNKVEGTGRFEGCQVTRGRHGRDNQRGPRDNDKGHAC